MTGDDAKVLAGGNANIQGNVIGESTTNVQADNNLSTGEKSQIIAPKVNLRAANDAVVAGIVNSGQKTTQESDGESTSKEISNVTVLAGNDARISGTISGFDNNQLETKRDMTLLPQGKILDGDVDLAAYNNLSIYGMAAADGTLSVKAKGDEDKTELILGEKSALSGNSVEVGSISDGNIQARGTIVGVEEVCVHTDSNARLTLGEKFNARAKKVFIKAGIYSGDASTVISGTIEGSELTHICVPEMKLDNTTNINGQTCILKAKYLLEFEPGYQVNAQGLAIVTNNIPAMEEDPTARIENFMSQTGLFDGINVTQTLGLQADMYFDFKHDCTSPARNFELNASNIHVNINSTNPLTLSAPGMLRLYAMDNDIRFHPKVTLNADFHDIYAARHVRGALTYKGTPYKGRMGDGYEAFTYEGVAINGGTGPAYTHIDTVTGEESQRNVAVRIRADGEIALEGMTIATSNGDIRIDGKDGVTNDGAAITYRQIHHRKRKDWESTKTDFWFGSCSTPGKVSINSEHGGYSQQAGQISVYDGAHITTRDAINMTPLTGWQSRKRKGGAVEKPPQIVNLGESTFQMSSSDSDVNATGLVYHGPNGELVISGKNIYLDRSILENVSSGAHWQPSIDFSAFSQWKSFEALQAAKDFMSAMKSHEFGNGLMNGINPSLTFGIDRVRSAARFQRLGQGALTTRGLTLCADNEICLNHGFAVTIYGDADISAHDFNQNGARLNSSGTTQSAGIYLAISWKGVDVGLRTSLTETDSVTWVPAVFNANGTVNFNVCNLSQDAAIMNINNATGQIECLWSRTRHDTSSTYSVSQSMGANVNWSGAVTPSLSMNAGFKESREANHTAGMNVGENSTLTIGSAELLGADLNGVIAATTNYQGLPSEYTDRGASIGLQISGAAHPKGTASFGVSNNGHQLNVALNIPVGEQQRDQTQLLETAGTVSYANRDKGISVTAPIVTGVNKEAFKELVSDTKAVAKDIANIFAPVVKQEEEQEAFAVAPQMAFGDGDEQVAASQYAEEVSAAIIEDALGVILAETIGSNLILELEILERPFMYAPSKKCAAEAFAYRIKGTRLYCKNIEQFNKITELIYKLRDSSSPYAQMALRSAIKSNGEVMLFDSALTPFGDPGDFANELRDMFIATENPHHPLDELVMHEGAHASVPKGAAIPGNKNDLLSAYGKDWSNIAGGKMGKLADLSPHQQRARLVMFDWPWRYFELLFSKGTNGLPLSDAEKLSILYECQESILKGKFPDFSNHVHGNILNQITSAATDGMLAEIGPYISQASGIADDAHVRASAPNSCAHLDEHLLKQPWYKTPTAMRTAIGAITLTDLALHVRFARKQQGLDWPDAIAEGTSRTIIDSSVNIPLYTVLGYLCGAPVALTMGAGAFVAGTIPSPVIDEELNACHARAHETLSRDGNFVDNCLASEADFDRAEVLGLVKAMQEGNGIIHGVCNAIDDTLHEYFPANGPHEYDVPTWMLDQ